MSFFKKLWHGKYSLYKTFWIYGALILLILKLPDGILKKMSPFALNQAMTFIVAYTFIVGAYQLVVIVGIWRSSTNYKGKEMWIYSAKAWCIASFIFLFMTTLNVFTIDGFYGFLYVFGFLLIAYLLDKPFDQSYVIKEKKENFIVNSSKPIQEYKKIDDESLWEIASKELTENKREGLWAKCFAEANGNDSLAKVAYLKLRVQQLNEGLIQKPLIADTKDTISEENTPLKSIVIKREYKELKGATPFDQNLTYTDLSVKNLLENGMYAVEKYEKKDLLFFYNGYVGCVNGSLVKVFETEDLCKKAIKDGMASSKYPKGLIVTIDKDTFDVY
jgi:hypothetical protein